jgi:hypothetical protein
VHGVKQSDYPSYQSIYLSVYLRAGTVGDPVGGRYLSCSPLPLLCRCSPRHSRGVVAIIVELAGKVIIIGKAVFLAAHKRAVMLCLRLCTGLSLPFLFCHARYKHSNWLIQVLLHMCISSTRQ